MAFETRHEAWQRGRSGQCIRLTLIAVSLATLTPSVHAQDVAVRSGATQMARLFGAVGSESANEASSSAPSDDFAQLLKIGNDTKMRMVVFQDYGHLVRNGPQAAETERVTAAGSRFDLRVTQGSNPSTKLDAAWSNKPAHTGDTDRPTVTRNFRLRGSLVYVFQSS